MFISYCRIYILQESEKLIFLSIFIMFATTYFNFKIIKTTDIKVGHIEDMIREGNTIKVFFFTFLAFCMNSS